MHTTSLNFKIIHHADVELQMDAIYSLLGAWRMNGQVLGDQFPTARTESGYRLYVNTPEADSLSNLNLNSHVRKYTEALLDAGLSTPEISPVGTEPQCVGVCSCVKPEFYILYTTHLALESPLRCGGCFKSIPLYRLQKADEDNYQDIIDWQADYQSCDDLQMGCRVGERFANSQMSNFDSPLSRMGLDVCDSISGKTDTPTYYYLYRWVAKSYENEVSRKCPKCEGAWRRQQPLHDTFDFVCDKCKLVSNIAWSVR